jgi:hypothetical protein
VSPSLACRLETQQREGKALAKALAGLHSETSRLNGLLAEAAGLRSALHEDNLVLESKLSAELQVGCVGGWWCSCRRFAFLACSAALLYCDLALACCLVSLRCHCSGFGSCCPCRSLWRVAGLP